MRMSVKPMGAVRSREGRDSRMETDMDTWFSKYVGIFVACGHGERPASEI
jgi:hypothetical protein